MTVAETMHLADINKQLSELWEQEQGLNKIRASLFNLVIYTKQSDQSALHELLLKNVVSKFPCRMILIVADEGEPHLDTKVSSETMGEGELQIFCEMIRIEVAGEYMERVPFLILPNLLPDLPIYLLWTQDPASETLILPHLEKIAHRIIFDAESTHHFGQFAKTVQAKLITSKVEIGDLNWSATTGWRALFAETFATAEALQILAHTQKLIITYNKRDVEHHHHTEIQAAYFQAWLASRLNWRPKTFELIEGNVRLTYHRPSHEAVVILKPEENEKAIPGAILSIETESVNHEGCYNFQLNPENKQVSVHFSNQTICHLPLTSPLPNATEGQAIIEEIFYPTPKEHYGTTMEILANIKWRET